MPSKLLRILLCCHEPPAPDEPFLHANRPLTVTPAVRSPASSTRSSAPPPSTPSSTRRAPPPPSPPPTTNHIASPAASIRLAPAMLDPLRRRYPSSHYPSSCYSRGTSSPAPTTTATDFPSWFTKSDTMRKIALGPWHPENLRVEFAAGCRSGAAPGGRSIYVLPQRG